jgi:hypothetical protein
MGCDGSALDQIMYQIQGSALFWPSFIFHSFCGSWEIIQWCKIENN